MYYCDKLCLINNYYILSLIPVIYCKKNRLTLHMCPIKLDQLVNLIYKKLPDDKIYGNAKIRCWLLRELNNNKLFINSHEYLKDIYLIK